MLRWEKEANPESETAYSGDLIIGSIVHQSVGERLWVYTVTGVNTKWVTKGHGFVTSRGSARRAVNRAWAEWLAQAAITPIREPSEAMIGAGAKVLHAFDPDRDAVALTVREILEAALAEI